MTKEKQNEYLKLAKYLEQNEGKVNLNRYSVMIGLSKNETKIFLLDHGFEQINALEDFKKWIKK